VYKKKLSILGRHNQILYSSLKYNLKKLRTGVLAALIPTEANYSRLFTSFDDLIYILFLIKTKERNYHIKCLLILSIIKNTIGAYGEAQVQCKRGGLTFILRLPGPER